MKTDHRCYIKSVAQVSCQKPLSDDWLTDPIRYGEKYVRAIEPESKDFIAPSEARRMSKLLKRSVCTALYALKKSGISQPDAIITGTGLGCVENSEKFLIDIARFGENCLKPTLFMQSTHNTISSLIGIVLKCHGYNNTYSHKGISFESALLDAWLQIKSGLISTALVGAHDEVTPFLALVEKQAHPEYQFISESSVSSVLSGSAEKCPASCEIEKVDILHKPEPEQLLQSLGEEPSILMTGFNGNDENDRPYLKLLDMFCGSPLCLHYKPLFGENFSSSAIGFYSAVRILEEGIVPDFMIHSGQKPIAPLSGITLVNHSGGKDWSIIKIRRS